MKKILWAIIVIFSAAMLSTMPMGISLHKAAATITATTETIAAQLITSQSDWEVLGTFLAVGDESDDLGITQRTQLGALSAIGASANGQRKIVIYGPLPIATNTMRFRNVGVADASDHVYNIYTGASGDHNFAYSLRGTMTFKCGTQVSDIGATVFADTLVITNTTASSTSWTVVNPGNNFVAEAFIDLQGDDMIIIVPTTLDDNSKLLGKFY